MQHFRVCNNLQTMCKILQTFVILLTALQAYDIMQSQATNVCMKRNPGPARDGLPPRKADTDRNKLYVEQKRRKNHGKS